MDLKTLFEKAFYRGIKLRKAPSGWLFSEGRIRRIMSPGYSDKRREGLVIYDDGEIISGELNGKILSEEEVYKELQKLVDKMKIGGTE